MIVVEVCKKCKCIEWTKEKCKCCGYNKCSAHKWFIPCENNEIARKGNLKFFIGNLEEYGLEDNYVK